MGDGRRDSKGEKRKKIEREEVEEQATRSEKKSCLIVCPVRAN